MRANDHPAMRRYMKRIIPITIAYIATIALATALVPDNAPASALTIGLALLPGMAALGWLWAMGRLLIELDDEYLRMLEVRKFLVATGATLAITSVWGVLELYSPEVPKLGVFFVFPIWCIGLALGQLVNRFGFGDPGPC
ncbi:MULTISPECIES: hypothetical protein [Blastomonas]|jgi:hypothetical protein|uniref:hypothetical protein n=1 Tax=Blastomonas TaxID=150203 RepID=UPI0024E1CE23|nr:MULTISPECIES: hypothetical protein [Blastomonas]MDK2758475.1 hypothetical protein [Blastomonas fulva]